MINFKLTIPGNPIPKGRPRFADGRAHTPQRTRDYEETVKTWVALFWQEEPTEVLLFVSLRFYRDSKRRADFDNLTKSVLDGMQGVVFVDDSQIKEAHIRIEVDRDNPRVEVWVRDFKEIADMDDLRRAAAQADWLGCVAQRGT